jgi:cytochrome c-type biogenesis protein CcmH/NrfG
VQLNPKWPDAYALLGRAYQQAGRRDDALKAFDTSKRLAQEERQRLEQKLIEPKTTPSPTPTP